MGVKYGREYEDIIEELSAAIGEVERIHDFFDMSDKDWDELDAAERQACIRTLADDVFYGLGADPVIELGSGAVRHDREGHRLLVSQGEREIAVVRLA